MDLSEATEIEKLERDRICHPTWGPPLAMEDWLRRESRLRAHAWSRRAMRTWLLRGEGGQVLSSCETFAMASRLVRGGEERAGRTYGVASVFTEERLRGRGHA